MKTLNSAFVITLVALVFSFNPAVAQQSPALETVFEDDARGIVWGFDFIDKDTMLINIKDGRMFLYDIPSGARKAVAIPPSDEGGQGGLLDVLYHPPTNYVYWTFSEERGENIITSLARGTFVRSTYKNNGVENIRVIFRSQVVGDGGRHFGSRLVIKGEHLYMTVGERGERDNAQILSNHNGSILRLTFDGFAVADNPFVNKEDALPEIFSYGHRNPQGIDIHPNSGELFSGEFGPWGGDELNLVQAGKNYGWPVISYGREYWGGKIGPTHKEGMEQPIVHWTPSISPSGMVFYRGDKIENWTGDLFLAALGERHLRRLVFKNNKIVKQEKHFEEANERIRQVRNSPDGYLYFSTDSGKVMRVVPQAEAQ